MMDNKNISMAERLFAWIGRLFGENRVPFLASFITGLAAHGFAFTNKLVNHDDIEALFGKGATITSGRWGLEMIKTLFPDGSMPWIYGLISLFLMSVAVCLVLRLLDIRSKPLQILLPMVVISFPSMTGNFCFMFTSAPYALSFLLAVLSVYIYNRGGLKNAVLSVLLLIVALSMYQAYISITASLFVLIMIGKALDGEKVGDNVLYGLKAILMMAVAIAVYYAVCLLVFQFTGAEFNTYVTDNVTGQLSIIRKVRMAYDAFVYVFTFRNFYIISCECSRYIHLVMMALLFVCAMLRLLRAKPLNAAMAAVLMLMLPLSICCMYLIMSPESIHTLVMYSFVSVYMLLAMLLERSEGKLRLYMSDAAALILAAIVVANVYYANMTYLQMHLQYENASSFYTSLVAQIKDTEGFDEDSSLAIIGRQDNLLHDFEQFDSELLMGPANDLVNIYSKENFIRYYMGFDIPFADEALAAQLAEDERVIAMPEYPYYGSVQKIDDCIVVKLG